MPITRLQVKNFKCFTDLSLPLAPLTVLTGFNAAGKSTVLHAILLMAQSLRTDSRRRSLPLNGSLVRLGTAGDVLAASAQGREVVITLQAQGEKLTWELTPIAPGTRALAVSNVIHAGGDGWSKSWSRQLYRSRESGSAIVKALKSTVALSAVRLGPADAFPVPDELNLVHADVGDIGQFAPWWYATQADEDVVSARRHSREPAPTLRRQLDAYLAELFPTGQATADEIPDTSLVHLGFRTGITSDWRRPANVGYGFTYAFPILVCLLIANPNQIIIIDSPEAHLHPSAQSRLGFILGKIAAAGLQILVETHSDHVVNGIRIAVRENVVRHSDVAVHFFDATDRTETQPAVFCLKMGSFGNIDDWPRGFFDQIETDLARL